MALVKGEQITVPVISDGAVNGYFLTLISLNVDKTKLQVIEGPKTELMTDELITLLAGSNMVNIANVSTFDVDEFKKRIREGLNKKLGDEVVQEVLIEKLDYLSKADIRSQQGGGEPQSVKIVEGEKVEAAAGQEAAPSH
ncbi:hypothetical protein D3C80_1436270 [compost metagenome]